MIPLRLNIRVTVKALTYLIVKMFKEFYSDHSNLTVIENQLQLSLIYHIVDGNCIIFVKILVSIIYLGIYI